MEQTKLWKLPTAKEYEKWMGIRSVRQRAAIVAAFQEMMKPLRAVLKRNVGIFYPRRPNARRPCDTCAYAVKTRRRKGFVSTSFMLMKSIRARKPFLCHADQPGFDKNEIDPTRLKLCMGFLLTVDDAMVKKAVAHASEKVLKELLRDEV